MVKILHADVLDLNLVEPGTTFRLWLNLTRDTLGNDVSIPVIVTKGIEPGPVLGLTAAVHGNEVNGIPVIQRVFKEIDPKTVKGTIVGIPVVNVPGLNDKVREFNDGKDLNHVFPGRPKGNESDVYAHRFFNNVIVHFDYLLDLHTASFGRVNSYYIRADMRDPVTAELARLQNAQIIVHNPPSDGTLRGAANEVNIPAITLEVGNPNTFQRGMIRTGMTGIFNAMAYLKMLNVPIEEAASEAVYCRYSYWIYTDTGGFLRVLVDLAEIVQKGQLIAIQANVFGDVVREYYAPDDGIVIGKSSHPVNQSGGRILHLGLFSE
jgi:uncharacterized protein